MKKVSGGAVLFLGLAFATVALWAQGTMSNNSSSNMSQPTVKKMGPKIASIYVEAAACARLDPVQAEDAPAVPTGRKMVVGPRSVPASVQGSSSLSETTGASRLFDGNPNTYWHVDRSKRLRAEWFVVGVGKKRSASVHYVRAMPRIDSPNQIFTTACLEGSNDGKQWHAIANLNLPASQRAAKWFGWRVPAVQSYRYFKLLIPHNNPEQNGDFYSIGKLEMYQ